MMPTEENQNIQTGDASSNNTKDNNVSNDDLNIDLNLDDLDLGDTIEEDKVEDKIETTIQDGNDLNQKSEVLDQEEKLEDSNNEKDNLDSNSNDWLVEEDKKAEEFDKGPVGEVLDENKQEDSDVVISSEDLFDNEPIEEEAKEDVENQTSELMENDIKEKQSELDEKEEIEKKEDIGELKGEEVKNEEYHTENLGVEVVENKEGDIVSDTGDVVENDTYVPNEHDFDEATKLLNNHDQGPVDLNNINEKNDNDTKLDVGIEESKNDEGFNLDDMIADIERENEQINKTAEQVMSEQGTPQSAVATAEQAVNNEQGAVNNEQGTMNSEQGTVNNEQGTVNSEQGTVNSEQGTVNNEQGIVDKKETPVEETLKDINQDSVSDNVVSNENQNINFGSTLEQQPVQTVVEQQSVQAVAEQQPVQTVVEQQSVQAVAEQQPVQAVAEQQLVQKTQPLNVPVQNATMPQGIPAGAVVMNAPYPGAIPGMPKKKKHGGLKIFLIIVALVALGAFVVSKMYPEEVKDITNAIKGENQVVVEYEEPENTNESLESEENVESLDSEDIPLEESNIKVEEVVSEDVLSGEVQDSESEELDPDSLAAQLDAESEITGDVQINENIGEVHEAAETEDFNAFEDIEEVLDEGLVEDEMLDKLYDYQSQGEEYDIWGREVGNKTAIKYGLFIYEKAGTAINKLENGEEIDTSTIDSYFAQFNTYLTKLEGLRDSFVGDEIVENTEEVVDGNVDNSLSGDNINESNTDTGEGQGAVEEEYQPESEISSGDTSSTGELQ